MMADQRVFSRITFFFATVTLLSCLNPVASFFLPQVTRTDDAIIIDFTDSGYASPIQRKDVYSEIANPGFVGAPSFNPYAMMYQQQQQPMVYNGWSFFYGHPGLSSRLPAGAPSTRQFDAEEEEEVFDDKEMVKQAPGQNATCGRGPLRFPGHHHHHQRSLINERIAGGAAAKKNAWSFIVTLKNSAGVLFCGGSLISDTKVLLAAQCLERLSLLDMSGVTILIGMTSATEVQMTRRISKVFLHSKYNAVNYANDIAIIVMDSPVVISKNVAPVCLPPASIDPDQYADQDAIILGWGTTDPKAQSDALQQGKVDMVPISECRADADFGKYVSESNICVSFSEKFTCSADIGGPVVILSSPGTWTQIGVNSYTKDGCVSNGLKTRVSAYKAWIDLYINK